MKGTSRVLAVAILALVLGGAVAEAHPHRTRADRSETRRDLRVRQAEKMRKITRQEVRRLQASQRRLAALERGALRDGRFTIRERARLQQELRRHGRMIHRMGHHPYRVYVY